MAFDLDDEELEATRKLNGVYKEVKMTDEEKKAIEVGEYIRTKDDGIKKLVKINEGKMSTYYGKYIVYPEYKNSKSVSYKNIVNHSHNILALIEVGDVLILWDKEYDEQYKSEVFLDYNNNLCVTNIEITKILDLKMELFKKSIKIKSILTKEQFASMEYKVEEDK